MNLSVKNEDKENIEKVVRYKGDVPGTALASKNRKKQQLKGLVEQRSSKDNSPEKENYQKPRSENQHGEKAPKK